MTETKGALPKAIDVKFKDAENMFDVYSNHTGIITTSYDLKLLFGAVQDATASGISVLRHGSVILSPQHAKVLCRALTEAIGQFEATYGEINLGNNPPNITHT